MTQIKIVNIIGAGLAGCEAAYQLAKRGVRVNLYEVKRIKKNSVQVLKGFAELVCSNSLRSNELSNAVGTLKEEMRLLDSLIIKAAEHSQVPAGGSLAVDRELFSDYITKAISENTNITIFDQEVDSIDQNAITLIASGPLTTDKLQNKLTKILGDGDFYFYDAVAPIIEKQSIDMTIAYEKNRYDKGETKDYINCPMDEISYNNFYNALINAEVAIGHLPGEAELKYFEGCMPVEAIAKRGKETLLFGPLKPKGLDYPGTTRNHAVVQLRQDDVSDKLYNMVGFQTNLKWPEQKKVFSMIPGLEKAKFVRYGVMHKNNFINSPKLLNEFLQLKANGKIFFAGQITGVEGYVESTISGLLAAINIERMLENKEMKIPSAKTVSGALLNYINKSSTTNFQPMKANWGIVAESGFIRPKQKLSKQEIKKLKALNNSDIAIQEIKKYIEELKN